MPDVADAAPWILSFALIGLLVLAALARYVMTREHVEVPPDASLLDTLARTPFLVAVFLDVNDLVLDSFGAPVAWVVLSRLGLAPLKKVAVIEALIPGTQVLPLFTAAWLVARVVRTKPQRALPGPS